MPLPLTSSALPPGGVIPKQYTCDGRYLRRQRYPPLLVNHPSLALAPTADAETVIAARGPT